MHSSFAIELCCNGKSGNVDRVCVTLVSSQVLKVASDVCCDFDFTATLTIA